MADKTKAVALNRQCGYEYRKTIPFDLTRPVAGRQRSGNAIFSASVTAPTAQLNHNILISKQSSNLSLVSSKIVGCILSVGCTAMQHTSFRVAKMQLGSSPQLWYQPFGSMPRDCSSFRKTRFIHVAREESPSFFISASSCARNSCWRRIWYWSVLALVLDIVITKSILSVGGCNYNVTEMVLQLLNMTKPCSARTLTGPLTKPLIGVTVMAEQQHTQTRPEFTWLFLATPDHTPECSPVVLRFDADTEDKARAAFPGWDLVFAAKIRAHAPCHVAFFDYTTRRGWEFDSAAIQEVRHA